MKKKIICTLIGFGLCFAAQAATAIWDGEDGAAANSNKAWTVGKNWVGDVVPTWGSTLDVYYYASGTTQLDSYLGTGSKVIRSLNLTDDADSTMILHTSVAGTGTPTLTFGGAGGAAITSTAGAAGNFTIGGGNGGGVILAEGLLLNHNGSGTFTIAKPVSGNFDISNSGSGEVILSAANTYAGTVINAGTMTLSGSNNFSGSVKLNAGTLNVNNAYALGVNNFEINGGTINNSSGAGITMSNNNAMVINGDFAFTGNQDLKFGTGNITLGTAAGTSRTITADSTIRVLQLNGDIADGSTATQLIKDGVGTLGLNGVNSTFSGGVVIKKGVVSLGNASANTGTSLAAGTGAITLGDAAGGDASLELGSYILNNAINLAPGAAGNLKIGTGGPTRAPKYAGAIALNGNNLTIEHRSSQNMQVLGGITGAGNLILTNGLAAGIKLTGADINNIGSIAMFGNGTSMTTNLVDAIIGANVTTLTVGDLVELTLSAANAYTGGTIVSNGVLIGTVADAFGTGGMTVTDGSTLILGDAATLDDLAALVLGSSSVLQLDFTGTDTVGSISLDGGSSWLSAGTYDAAALATAGGLGAYSGTGSLTVIPEPATIGMLGLGALITMLLRRMRTR